MKKFLIGLLIFVMVFCSFPLEVYASGSLDALECPSPQESYEVSSDNYLVWYDYIDNTYYVWFLSTVSNIKYQYNNVDNGLDCYDAYGKTYSLNSTLDEYTLVSKGWDILDSHYNSNSSNVYLVYSTHERVNATDSSIFMTAGYNNGFTPDDSETEDDTTTDEETKGLLGTIISNVKEILTNLKNGFLNLSTSISNNLTTLGTNIVSGLSEFLENISSGIENLKEELFNLGSNIITGIGDFFNGLIFPEDGYLENKKEQLETSFSGLMGFDVSEVEAYFNKSSKAETIIDAEETTIKCGSLTFKFKAFDNTWLLVGIDKFRSIIRGFVALCLIFFNMNQMLNVIGQGSITQMIGISNKQANGGKE